MNRLGLIAFIILAGCARAEWQENVGNGPLAQEQNGGDKPSAPAPTPFPDPIKFTDCQSQTLNVSIDTAKTRESLRDFRTVLARYPQIKRTRASQTKLKSVFFLNAHDSTKKACADEACAEQAGWSLIQDDINSLNDVTLACEGDAARF